jgi:hypothetical protein
MLNNPREEVALRLAGEKDLQLYYQIQNGDADWPALFLIASQPLRWSAIYTNQVPLPLQLHLKSENSLRSFYPDDSIKDVNCTKSNSGQDGGT